jgi:hypothetical protein
MLGFDHLLSVRFLSDSCQILSAFAYFPIGCGFKLWQTANSCADTETQVLNFRSRGVVLGHLGLVGLAAKRSAITEPVQHTDGYRWIQMDTDGYSRMIQFSIFYLFRIFSNDDSTMMDDKIQKNEVINPKCSSTICATTSSFSFKRLQKPSKWRSFRTHSFFVPFS